MKELKSKKRVSKAQWLEKALDVLESDGLEEVKIERLARELKVSRSGFYWHFNNRQELIRAMIQLWGEEYTSIVTKDPKILSSRPKDKLYRIMRMIREYDLTRYDLAMRASAEKDPLAREMINKIYQLRMDFVRSVFAEMGFEGDELEMRTHLFVCYHSWENIMFTELSRSKHTRLLKQRLELFVRK